MSRKLLARSSTDSLDYLVLYTSSELELAHCMPPDSTNTIYFSESFGTCREFFIDEFRTFLNLLPRKVKSADVLNYMERVTVCTKHASFLIAWKTREKGERRRKIERNLKSWMKSAKRILNDIEKTKGWKATTITKVGIHKKTAESYNKDILPLLFWVNGSKHWIKAPQLFSLYVLLIRIMRNMNFRKAKTFNDLIKEINKEQIKNNRSRNKPFGKLYDSEHLYNCDKWEILIANDRFIYKNRSMSDNYMEEVYDDKDGTTEGVDRLCSGNSLDREVLTRFLKAAENGKRLIN